MSRKRSARLLVVLALLCGVFAFPIVAWAISYSVTFDPGGHIYSILYGVHDTVGNPGYGVRGVSPDGHANKRYSAVNVPVVCTSDTVSVSFQVRFNTGNQNDYLEAQLWLFNGETQVGYYNFGYQLRTPNTWLNFNRDVAPSSSVTRVLVLTGYWELNPDYVYLDNISITCTAGGGPDYDSSPPAGATLSFAAAIGETDTSTIVVSNLGDETLSITSLTLSGAHASDFTIGTSPFNISPSGDPVNVQVACFPSNTGERTATLTIATNDIDEPLNYYYLSCDGLGGNETVYYGHCVLLGQSATFRAGWTYSGGAGNPEGTTYGLSLPPSGEARFPLILTPSRRYSIIMKWHTTDPTAGETFRVSLGDHAGFSIPMPNDTASHEYTLPAANYPPDAGSGYTLRLWKDSGETDPGLIVDYVCVARANDSWTYGGGGGSELPSCDACVYEPLGDLGSDLPAVIEWLFCSLRRLIECELMVAIRGIWATVNEQLIFLSSFRLYIDEVLFYWGQSTATNTQILGQYLGGHVSNIGQGVARSMQAGGLAETQNQIAAGVGNIAPVMHNMSSGVGTRGNIGGALNDPLRAISEALGTLITMVPEFIDSMVSGFNAEAVEAPSGAISCADTEQILYYPCLGLYVVDNTIFQGPAAYLIPVLMGVFAWDALTWAIAKFKEAFSK